jgi:hypothetical protein
MDRSWVFGKQFTTVYVKGVEDFMRFVSERYREDEHIRCPCVNCHNRRLMHQNQVETHLHIYGISPTYSRWTHHGEAADVEIDEGIDQEVERHDNDFGIHVDENEDGYDEDH